MSLLIEALFALAKPLALAIGLENVYAVGEPVAQHAGELFAAMISVQLSNGKFVVTIRLVRLQVHLTTSKSSSAPAF